MKNIPIDIAVVGAGPAGISTAVHLAKKGHSNLIVFERESYIGGVPNHCGHLGFGMMEFKRVLSGPDYAKKLAQLVLQHNITVILNATLIQIDANTLTFSTPDGMIQYTAQRTVLALGAREVPRSTRLISGTRSTNIITTGALQRFVYMHNRSPFKKAVIIGSEIVSFSALMTAKHAGIKVQAILEEKESIDSYSILKPLTQYFLNTPVLTSTKIIKIEGTDGNIKGVTIEHNNTVETIECDGIIFSGMFTPESSVLQESFNDFNYCNNSVFVSQDFQTTHKNIFVAGNVIRGALAAFKCYAEGEKVALSVDASLKNTQQKTFVKIDVSKNIQWYFPSMIDPQTKK
ncbi:MAG: FAD/NAD(P)-binding oxidoreductase, partial [Campylobacterota bacterium]|nr:FAD/NAD(P)-binding oxidoreductase [Campylobacterota bacterium]